MASKNVLSEDCNGRSKVPKVFCAFVHKVHTYIVMERIQGDVLPQAWKTLSDESRAKVYAQLKAMVKQLREMTPPPGTGVESCVGGSLYDPRLPDRPEFGSFKTIQELHAWLRQDFDPSAHPERRRDSDWQDLEKMVRLQDGSWLPPVFAHADLNPFNILLRGDRIVRIIDWECSGWYPHYWEYTSAWHGNIIRTGWRDAIDQFLEPFPAELEMEHIRHKRWGEW